MSVPTWSAPPLEPSLANREVHLWRAFLDDCRPTHERFDATLTEDEWARAGRFAFARDRDRFIAGRGILRAILGQYLRCPPGAIRFTYESEGKPRIHFPRSGPVPRFNLAHSHGLAVYAISSDREIGIDVEAVRPEVAAEEIAERFFSVAERAELGSLPPDQRYEPFFLGWTRKEAYVKARGCGLGIALDSFDVSLTPGRPEILVSTDSGRWTLRAFQPAEHYAGAVVAEGGDWTLCYWDWHSGGV